MLHSFQDSQASYDFIHNDRDPTPENYYGDDPDSHGTMCAGTVGMVKSNGYCGAGVAYSANIGGITSTDSYNDVSHTQRVEKGAAIPNAVKTFCIAKDSCG